MSDNPTVLTREESVNSIKETYLESEMEWIDVNTQVPNENIPALLTDGKIIFIDKPYQRYTERDDGDGDEFGWTGIYDDEKTKVTHWKKIHDVN